ncbi:D-alanyl-D-alanine carboxypeptidase family protein [Peribacillus kribbensis]|uniref:D-alanyl-D-alanine carboxypeptidase family protein n=1 Tax=Peribacillus kribbensis TaxID=356658 RepID=UPI00042035A5|nr:D-alanyl-D-alanine carboxypeptidase family protein [Peribacillus kribbensis]
MKILHKSVIILVLFGLVASAVPKRAEGAGISVSAKSAVLMEQKSGRVLYAKNENEPRRIASITKIMTAIVAIESGKMQKTVTISHTAAGTEGSSLYLKPGQKMKLEDLVYGMMLRSGNDSAAAIAEYVGGSLEGFSYLMNKKAEEIGMHHSHFSNPHGLDNTKDHYSSAYDMALLTRYAMNNKEYRKIAGTKVHKAPNPYENWDYTWKNKNRLLTQLYKYCTGGKTGYTKMARRTLVTTAHKDGLDLIAVTLNDGNDWDDHKSLFESGFKNYDLTALAHSGEIKGIKNKIYKNNVYLKNDFLFPLTSKEADSVTSKIRLLKPKTGWKDKEDIPEVVGKMSFYLEGKKIGSRNIFYGKLNVKPTLLQSWKTMLSAALGIQNG